MGRRAAALLTMAAVVLLFGAGGLSFYLERTARRSAEDLLTRRLESVGEAAARLLGTTAPGSELDRALGDVARRGELDGAYVFDERFRIVADAQGRTGHSVNLLRLEPDRARDAIGGHASVGWAFDLEGLRFLGGYFPVPAGPLGQRPMALALEAGPSFTAPLRRLQAAAIGAFSIAGLLGVLALAAVWRGVRAASREREAYGRAQRAGLASRMAAMVAHEVRNPLGIIRGGADLLRERAKDDKDRDLCDDILGEVRRLNAITEDFLALARDQTLRLGPVDVAALCDDVAAKLRLRYPSLELSTACAGAGTIQADEQRCRQVLLNLVVNAAEAAGNEGRVRIEAARDQAAVSVSVIDDGPGVDPAIAPHLFEPFSSGKRGGTGLGLALARRIAEQHGGRLDLVPSSGGARFDLRLPLDARAEPAP